MRQIRKAGSDRRRSLLQAALELFSTQGYAGTTTKAIAERSGVTEAMLFRHFLSKEELLRAVVDTFDPRPLFSPLPASLHTLPARAALELLLTRYLDAIWTNRVFLLMVYTTPKREQAVFEEIWAEFRNQGLALYTLLQGYSDRKELKAEIAAVATDVVAAAASGYVQRLLSDPPEDWGTTRDGYISHLLQILFEGIE